MRLTDYEKAMLDGRHGSMRQQAMEALCDLARFYDVDIPVVNVSEEDYAKLEGAEKVEFSADRDEIDIYF